MSAPPWQLQWYTTLMSGPAMKEQEDTPLVLYGPVVSQLHQGIKGSRLEATGRLYVRVHKLHLVVTVT